RTAISGSVRSAGSNFFDRRGWGGRSMSSGEINAGDERAADVSHRDEPSQPVAEEQESRPSSEEVCEGPLMLVVTRPSAEEIQRFFAELRLTSELAIILYILPGASADSLDLGPSL